MNVDITRAVAIERLIWLPDTCPTWWFSKGSPPSSGRTYWIWSGPCRSRFQPPELPASPPGLRVPFQQMAFFRSKTCTVPTHFQFSDWLSLSPERPKMTNQGSWPLNYDLKYDHDFLKGEGRKKEREKKFLKSKTKRPGQYRFSHPIRLRKQLIYVKVLSCLWINPLRAVLSEKELKQKAMEVFKAAS